MFGKLAKNKAIANLEQRVEITYDVTLDGAKRAIELPLVFGVLANFSGGTCKDRVRVEDRRFIDIDASNFNQVLASLQPSVRIVAPDPSDSSEELSIEICFRRLDDFLPQNMSRRELPLESILNAPEFLRLEATWRGLFYLITSSAPDAHSKVRIFDVSKAELHEALTNHKKLDQSNPFVRELYIDTFCRPRGEPFGCLVGDYYFDQSLEDWETLSELSRLSALALVPFIAGASPQIVGRKSFGGHPSCDDLSKQIEIPADRALWARWRILRESELSCFLGLTLPRILVRHPYDLSNNSGSVTEAPGREGDGISQPCWANATFAMAANIRRSFKERGWPDKIRGFESGGLPEEPIKVEGGGTFAEVSISVRAEVGFAKAGYMSLAYRADMNATGFIGAQSICQPPEYQDLDRRCDVQLSARMPYILVATRIAHYLKCLYRDSDVSRDDPRAVEEMFCNWLSALIISNPGHKSDLERSRQPLSAASVSVKRSEDRPDVLQLSVGINPYYGLYGMTSLLRLDTMLVKEANALLPNLEGIDLSVAYPYGVVDAGKETDRSMRTVSARA